MITGVGLPAGLPVGSGALQDMETDAHNSSATSPLVQSPCRRALRTSCPVVLHNVAPSLPPHEATSSTG
jgi:hypothetical protein